LSRKFNEHQHDIKGQTKTGKAKWISNQKRASEEINSLIAKSVKELSNPNTRKAAINRVKAKLGQIPKLL
jgi:hypothetical protein